MKISEAKMYVVVLHYNGGEYPGACEIRMFNTYNKALEEANYHRNSKSRRDGDAWIYTLNAHQYHEEDL